MFERFCNLSKPNRAKPILVLLLLLGTALSLFGCSRMDYRRRADRDAYCLVESRQVNSLWAIPKRTVEPKSPKAVSRLADANCPDCGPKPPDDPAAGYFQRNPGCTYNNDYEGCPETNSIEQFEYLQYLPKDETGQIEITPQSAIELALLHSRQYQTQFEQVYLEALGLSGNRFEFSTQWFGGFDTDFFKSGSSANDSRVLTVSDRIGFQRNLARGGQFVTSVANSLSWQFAGGQVSRAGGGIVAALTLPLLRGAGRYVRLEGLIQAERDLLYLVRDFARFRRRFYFETLNSYYRLLGQVQSIRNTRTNLQSLELNLIEHQELLERKMVSQIQVDQVFQEYQSGRLFLLSSEQSLADALDAFKLQLGLPTWAKMKIDEGLLQQFEFVSTDLEAIQQEINELFNELLTYLPPDAPNQEEAQAFFERYKTLLNRVAQKLPEVKQEFAAWRKKLESFEAERADPDDRLDHRQQATIANQLLERVNDLEEAIKIDLAEVGQLRRLTEEPNLIEQEADYDGKTPVGEIRWDLLQRAVGRRLREHIAELYTAQVQSRVFAIELEPIRLSQETAMQFAVENRLDLMNGRAQVMDSYRNVQVAANALRSQLDVRASANLGTDPNRANLVRFDASANTYNVGLNFDGPLNRLNERNVYRATQIGYQQARRSYMANEDAILNSIRNNLRQLRIQRLNFQIARQQLVAATRQVDEAQINLRTAAQSSTNLTRDLLQALQGLLGSKNNLIGSWIGYQTSRIALFVDLELLYLDEEGNWINESQNLNELQALLQSSDQREELSRIYGILRSPLFESVEGAGATEELDLDDLDDQENQPEN